MIENHPNDVIIDMSFMFVIRDKNTKDIWFIGTVYDKEAYILTY